VSEVDLGWSALAGLAAISAGCAAATLLVLRRFSDQKAVTRAKNLAQAHLLEIRLFGDDPRQVLRSQRALVMDQVRLLALLVRPMLILAIPMLLLLGELDAVYGHVPLRPGEPAIVTVRLTNAARSVSLEAPAGIIVETPPVHVTNDNQVSWRIQPLHPLSGMLQIREDGRVFTRPIIASWSIVRLAGLFNRQIEISYPTASVLGLPWLVWFFVIAAIAGLVLRGPLRTAI
jgi:uncharacterized membrane protein (DUF106 family)